VVWLKWVQQSYDTHESRWSSAHFSRRTLVVLNVCAESDRSSMNYRNGGIALLKEA